MQTYNTSCYSEYKSSYIYVKSFVATYIQTALHTNQINPIFVR